jgi:hypothetical protein
MYPSLAAQIVAAACCAKALEAEEKTPRRSAGKHRFTGLNNALCERLQVGRENAVTKHAVRQLLTDLSYAESGLGAALSALSTAGRIYKTGCRGSYRYYRLS